METKNLPAVIQTAVTAQKIDLNKVNLLLPSQTFGEVLGAYDKVTLEVLSISTDLQAKEVYKQGKEFALTKIALQRISTAIALQEIPQHTTILESTMKISRAKATGMMRKPNGELIVKTDEKTINMEVIEMELRKNAEEDSEDGNPEKVTKWGEKNGKKFPEAFAPWENEEARKRWIEKTVKTAMIQKLKFKDELAMSGAMNRVIRKFLAIKSTYTIEELAKPFVFPRVTLDTSKMLDDPKMRDAAVNMISGNAATLYGPETNDPQVEKRVEPEKITDAERVEESPDLWGPEQKQPEKDPRREAAIDALEQYMMSDYLSPAQKGIIRGLIDNPATLAELEKYVGLCKDQEAARRRGV